MKLDELKNMLEQLGPNELIELNDMLGDITRKAEIARKQREEAERTIQRMYPMCKCGEPIAQYGYLMMTVNRCKPSIYATNDQKVHGVIVVACDDDGPEETPAQEVLRSMGLSWPDDAYMAFGSCGRSDCQEWIPFASTSAIGRSDDEGVVRRVWADSASEFERMKTVSLTPMNYLASNLKED